MFSRFIELTFLSALVLLLSLTLLPAQDDVRAAVERARLLAEKVDDPGSRAALQSSVASILFQLNRKSTAIDLFTQSLSNAMDKKDQQAVRIIAENKARAGLFDDALTTVERIVSIENGDQRERDKGLQFIVRELAKHNKFDQALEVVSRISQPYYRSMALTSVAECALVAGEHDLRVTVLEQALDLAKSCSSVSEWFQTTALIVKEYERAGQIEAAKRIINTAAEGPMSPIKSYFIMSFWAELGDVENVRIAGAKFIADESIPDREPAYLGVLAFAQAESSQLDDARNTVDLLKNTRDFELAACRVATAFAKEGRLDEATALLLSQKDNDKKEGRFYLETLLEIAATYLKAGDVEKCKALLATAQDVVVNGRRRIVGGYSESLAAMQGEFGLEFEFRELLDALNSPVEKAFALIGYCRGRLKRQAGLK